MEFEFNDFVALRRARQLWLDGHADQAFLAFELAMEERPQNVLALIEFAEVMGKCYQIEFAEELLERARDLAAETPNVVSRIAIAFDRVHRTYKAIELLEELRSANNVSSQHLGQLAILYEKFNRLDAAYETICECVQEAPDQAEPKLIKARILRIRGESEEAERLLRDVLAIGDGPPLLFVRAWSEICLLRDREGDFAGAIFAIDEARSLQRQFPEVPQLQRRNQAISQALQSVYASIDQETVNRWSSDKTPLSRDCGGTAHLLGFPRSGTTLLERILDAHRSVVSSPEQAIFTDQIFPLMCRNQDASILSFPSLDTMRAKELTALRELYLQCHQLVLGQPLGGRILLDKNPNHTSLIAGLFRLLPESRFIVALRDPRDVIVSNYLRFFPLNEFSSAFLTWEGTVDQYIHDMIIWLRMRELLLGNWVEVRYEDTVKDMESQARRALSLCGLDWDASLRDYRQGLEDHLIHSPSRHEVTQPIHTQAVGRWQNYRQWLHPWLEKLSPILDAFGYSQG